MPMYEYECTACGHRFERIQKFSDPPIDECPHCVEHKVQKLLSSPAIQFKGTGWYITDYARKGAAGTDAKAASDTSNDKGSSESKESKGSGESKKESTESRQSKESKGSRESKDPKSAPPASPPPTTAKASGE
jgi:putative FmdB family regulatory protein